MASSQKKRKLDVVDLTGDSAEDTTSGVKKHSRQHLPTPPTSSAPSSSATQPYQRRDGDPEDWLEDASTEIQSSADYDDSAYQTWRLYGTQHSKVVGIRYYSGRATQGEHVMLRREPGNPYDKNAIRVDNVRGDQIGHIPKNMAAKLSGFLDEKLLLIEGILAGPRDVFDIPLDLKLYGTSDPVAASALKQQMKDARLPINELTAAERERQKREKERERQKAAERKQMLKDAAKNAGGLSRQGSGNAEIEETKGKGYANMSIPGDTPDNPSPSLEEIIGRTTSFDPREVSKVADKYGAGEDKLKALPYADQPNDLVTELLPYQRQGLAWMLDRESPKLPETPSSDPVQLWKKHAKGGYINIATNYAVNDPSLASGGILADDMGLGKTIQVISLLVADPMRSAKQPTLIVCPLSVMSNWSGQIEAHIRSKSALSVLVYHGVGREQRKPAEINQYDVVITTYGMMAQEYLPGSAKQNTPQPIPRKDGLFAVQWRRVVLDEGHSIRNPKTKMALAASALMASSRWVLTGTPIVNNLRDLYSHVKFLKMRGGLDQQEVFSSVLIRPLSQGRQDANVLLQALMATICLRRMKDMKFVDLRLPQMTSHRYTVNWLPQEREKYNAFKAQAEGLLLQYQNKNNPKGMNTYSHLLEVLLRMRQCCNHFKLCGDERVKGLMELLEQNKKVEMNGENIKQLRRLLQVSIESQEECPVCLDTLHQPVITSCGHIFGGDCIERIVETSKKCPLCRNQLDKDCLVQPALENGENLRTDIDAETSSSKVEAIMDILKASQKKGDVKTVVFSQWTSFLNILERQLSDKYKIKCCRLDGTMKASERDEAMDALAKDDQCNVMLASLGVCSVGLNLNAANQVILTDTWWSPAIEDQAVDRVHRLGQKRPVTAIRLVMEDSIEERVVGIQQEKRKLMMTAFQETQMKRGNEKTSRLADIQKLLGN